MWEDGRRVEAFEEMYRRCYPRLVELCRRSLCGRGDPEAIAQEAFVKAWASLDRFTGAKPFWPWVATIARHLCIDHQRRLERETCNLHIAARLSETLASPPDEDAEANDERRSVLKALGRLKPSEQRVIAMRDLNGWSYDEIAQFEGATVEAIRGSLKRARASLRQSYAKVAAGAPAAVGSLGPVLRQRHRPFTRLANHQPATFASCLSAAEAMTGAFIAAVSLLVASAPAVPDHGGLTAREPVVESSAVASEPAPSTAPSLAAPPPGRSPDVRVDAPRGSAGESPLGLPSDGGATPEDTVVTDLTPSPSYRQDRTVFGVGTVATGCAYATCAALFRSPDAGASWERLPAVGFVGGSLLLPPTFPADGRMFVSGPAGLQVSLDGGQSFQLLTPLTGNAAMSPSFAEDGRIVIGQAPLWEYRTAMGMAQPSSLLVPSSAPEPTPLFSPKYEQDGVVHIGATATTTSGLQGGAVFTCVETVCEEAALLEGLTGAPKLASDDHTLVAWRGDRLFVAQRGSSFRERTLPLRGSVTDVAFDKSGRLFVSFRETTADGTKGGLAVSPDAGASWRVLGAGGLLDAGIETVAVTADRIVVGLAGRPGGVGCSSDGGRTWERRCDG